MTSRYRTRLVPQGVIPKDLNIGVRLTPLGVPPPAEGPEGPTPEPPPCVVECQQISLVGWTSAGGVASPVTGSNASPVPMEGGPWSIQVYIIETQAHTPALCGKVPEWTFSGDLVVGTDFVFADAVVSIWLFGMRGCDPPYAGGLTIQPKIDGVNFCDPLELAFSGDGGGCAGTVGEACFRDEADANPELAGITFPNTTSTSIPFTDVGANAGGAPLFWQIVQTAGPATSATPSITSGDQINYSFDVGNGAADDLTGVNFSVTPFFDAEFTNQYCNGFVFFCEDV